jgi:hypothetical protein
MSKNKSKAMSRAVESPGKPRGRQPIVMIAILLIGLLMTGGALAQWSALWPAPQKSKTSSAEIAPASFTPTQPAKEYVYVNGKPVATEEPPGPCTYTLASTSQSFAASSGNGSVAVTVAGTNCNWTAGSNANWITVTSGTNYSGNGTVSFSFTANSLNDIRNGTITIANQTFTVYQGKEFTTDVPPSHPFYHEIGKLVARGVTAGCGATSYCPDQTLTREQMAALVIKGLGEFNPPTPASQRFNDVPPSNPFYNFIDRMAVLNITVGCGANTYCPSDPIPHEQMAAFVIRAIGMTSPPPPQMQRFNDVTSANGFYAFIDQMAERNIWTGCQVSPALYCPSSVVTRGQMAAILVRAFNL